MAISNFGGKKAAPFGSRKAKNTNRKMSSTKKADGDPKDPESAAEDRAEGNAKIKYAFMKKK